MSAPVNPSESNIIDFPYPKAGRPTADVVEWTHMARWAVDGWIGIDKLKGENTFVVWRQMQDTTDIIPTPSVSGACSMLMMFAFDIKNSNAADCLGDTGAVFAEDLDYQLRSIMRELEPYADIFREANVKLLDEGYDLQRSHDAADTWSERLDREELEASLREVAEEEERTGFETRYFAVEAPPPELRVVE